MSHFVYVVEVDGFCKVGIAANLTTRLQNYSCNCPHEVKLLQSFHTNSKYDSALIEKNIHNRLKIMNLHHRYEWFIRGGMNTVLQIAGDEYNLYRSSNFLKSDIDEIDDNYKLKLDEVITLLQDRISTKVSEATGISHHVINNIKSGQSIPAYSIIKLLAEYLGVKDAN